MAQQVPPRDVVGRALKNIGVTHWQNGKLRGKKQGPDQVKISDRFMLAAK